MGSRINSGRTRRWLRKRTGLGALVGLANRDRDRLLWQAHKQLRKNQLDNAAEIYRATLTFWPGDIGARLGLAACAQLSGDLATAERDYDELLHDDPQNPHALANRAEVRILTGQRDRAREDLAALAGLPHRKLRHAGLVNRLEALQKLAGETE